MCVSCMYQRVSALRSSFMYENISMCISQSACISVYHERIRVLHQLVYHMYHTCITLYHVVSRSVYHMYHTCITLYHVPCITLCITGGAVIQEGSSDT